jgi:hypothetical protein
VRELTARRVPVLRWAGEDRQAAATGLDVLVRTGLGRPTRSRP